MLSTCKINKILLRVITSHRFWDNVMSFIEVTFNRTLFIAVLGNQFLIVQFVVHTKLPIFFVEYCILLCRPDHIIRDVHVRVFRTHLSSTDFIVRSGPYILVVAPSKVFLSWLGSGLPFRVFPEFTRFIDLLVKGHHVLH